MVFSLVLALIRTLFPKLRVSIVRRSTGPKSVDEFSGLKRAKLRQLSFFGLVKSKWPIGGSLLWGVQFSYRDGIRRVLSSFFSSLFSAEDVDLAARDSWLGSLEPSLSPQQAETCEGPLTVAECHQALLGMPVGRRLALTVSLLNFTFAFGVFLGRNWWTFLTFVFLLVFWPGVNVVGLFH